MKIKARPGRASPFKTSAGDSAFQRFVARDGPLGRIFQDSTLRLAPAKGAREYRERAEYAQVYDQTYFAHALNVATTAAILFEAADAAEGREPEEREMRVVLAAGILHDVNKLPFAVSVVGRRSLAKTFAECRGPVRALADSFVDEKGFDGAVGLALSVEEGTSREAADYALGVVAPRRGSLAQLCLTLSDRLVGTFADPNDAEGYAAVVARFRAEHRDFPEIRVQGFTLVPQAALARAARQSFLDWVRDHGTLLHETERYASWIGPAPTEEDLERMDDELWKRVRPSAKEAFRKAGASHHSVRTSWAASIDPTPEIVDEWIETLGGQLVVWQGRWGIENFEALTREFPGVFKHDTKPQERVRVQLPESDETRESGAPPAAQARALAKLVIANCVQQVLSSTRTYPPGDRGPFRSEGIDGVMTATVPGILWARAKKGDSKAYESTIGEVAILIRSRETTAANPVAGFARAVLGGSLAPAAVASTSEACVYCGGAAVKELDAGLVFGIKPTAWAPRKKGVQRESHRGRICDRCVIENQLRDAMARDSNAPRSDAGFLTAHIHAADLVCDVRWGALTPILESQAGIAGEGKLILVGKRDRDGGIDAKRSQLVPLRGHVSVPVPKPAASGKTSETLAHLYRLRDFLLFARETGFKLHISPLALTPVQERAQFRWTNAPPWMEALGLAEVHVDDLLDGTDGPGTSVPSTHRVVEALLRAGRETGGAQGHRAFISRLLRNRLSVYDFPEARPPTDADQRGFIETLEDRYVLPDEKAKITQAAHAYIRFNARGEWSNNTWTWATRHYLELRDRYHAEADGRTLVVGDLLAAAQRKNQFARVDEIEAFVATMEDYLATFRGGDSPIGSDQRVLINAVAYLCKRDYRKIFPEE